MFFGRERSTSVMTNSARLQPGALSTRSSRWNMASVLWESPDAPGNRHNVILTGGLHSHQMVARRFIAIRDALLGRRNPIRIPGRESKLVATRENGPNWRVLHRK